MRVDDAQLLDEVLQETVDYSADLKALVLRMLHQQEGNVEAVANQTGLPLSTIYQWLSRWNQEQQVSKKKPDEPARTGGRGQKARGGVGLGCLAHSPAKPVRPALDG